MQLKRAGLAAPTLLGAGRLVAVPVEADGYCCWWRGGGCIAAAAPPTDLAGERLRSKRPARTSLARGMRAGIFWLIHPIGFQKVRFASID